MTNAYFFTIAGICLALGGWLVFLTVKLSRIDKKTRFLGNASNPKGLVSLIETHMAEINDVKVQSKKLEEKMKGVSIIANLGYHKTGFIRYNPFGDVGGNQSFSLCLLNSDDDGFVISSIHSRDGTRVYSKKITKGVSEYNLSEEEKKVIEIAKGGKKNV